MADAILRQQRGPFHLRLYSAFHGDKLAKQLIAAAGSANLRQVCAILTRMVLSEAVGVLRANRRHSMAFCR